LFRDILIFVEGAQTLQHLAVVNMNDEEKLMQQYGITSEKHTKFF
jgi:hypothetical protein